MKIIIVGGGLGGLIAGAKLSKEGFQVLLIEQHNIVGGCATTFRRKDFQVEVGLHEIDGFDNEDIKIEIFENLRILNKLTLISIPDLYHIRMKDFNFTFSSNLFEAKKSIYSLFPNEKKGVDHYFSTILRIQKELNFLQKKGWLKYYTNPHFENKILIENKISNLTVGDFLDSITNDELLKLILVGNITYYHDDPYQLSLLYYASSQGSYYRGGSWYIKGGSQILSNLLKDCIVKHGGEILLNHRVDKIIIENNSAIGIRCFENKKADSVKDKKIFRSEKVICNCSVNGLINMLQIKNVRDIISPKHMEIGPSLLSIYILFNIEMSKLFETSYSTIFFHDTIKGIIDLKESNYASFDRRAFIFVDYSKIDSGSSPIGKSLGTICCISNISEWEFLDKEQYKKKKKEVADIFIKRLSIYYPNINIYINHIEVATPLTIKKYTLNDEGAVYGFSQLTSQSGMNRIKNNTAINNLHLASAWVTPGGGFTGAISSGWACANGIIEKCQTLK